MDDLIKRLRAQVPYQGKSNVAFLCHEAATRVTSLEQALEQAAEWFEDYAAEHYRKAKNAPDGREQHGREVKGKLNKERADILRATLRGEG